MRRFHWTYSCISILPLVLSFSCSADDSSDGPIGSATGGAAQASGGSTASSGGAPPSSGGSLNAAGGTTTGGASPVASGGASESGGAPSGGATSAGGSGGMPDGTGGATASGGSGGEDRVFGNCVPPSTYDLSHVQAAYDLWKETVVTSEGANGFLRVRKPDSGTQIDSTVSEGIGYGMLLAVYMDDQEVFDGLWKYTEQYLNENGLMHWEISPNGDVIGQGAALDGDEDMAWALIMADRKWGGQGTLDETYLEIARNLIFAMWEHEIDHTRNDMPLPGDSWGNVDVTNVSYYAPAYYRVFGQVTDMEDEWNNVVTTSYDVLEASLNAENGNTENGLVPAWSNYAGEPVVAYDGAPTHFQNDSTRTPFRVGQDYCYYGEPRAKAYMEKITSFYVSVGVENIVDGYALDGTPMPDFGTDGTGSASFVGPAAVGASYSTDNQAFIDDAYAALITQELTAGTIYYQKSWAAISLLMMTGGFYELPAMP